MKEIYFELRKSLNLQAAVAFTLAKHYAQKGLSFPIPQKREMA